MKAPRTLQGVAYTVGRPDVPSNTNHALGEAKSRCWMISSCKVAKKR